MTTTISTTNANTLRNKIDTTNISNNLIDVSNKPANSCTLNLPNYEDVRNSNMKSINDYYDDLLTQYTKNYSDYARNSSGNASDRTYAETQLKPKTTDLNNQIIKLNHTMIDSINKDNDVIITLKNQLEDKNKIINDNILTIDNLKKKISTVDNQYGLKKENLNESQEQNDTMKFWSWIYIGLNIILVLFILVLIIYLLFSKSSSATNNSNKMNILTSNLNPGVTSKKINVTV